MPHKECSREALTSVECEHRRKAAHTRKGLEREDFVKEETCDWQMCVGAGRSPEIPPRWKGMTT